MGSSFLQNEDWRSARFSEIHRKFVQKILDLRRAGQFSQSFQWISEVCWEFLHGFIISMIVSIFPRLHYYIRMSHGGIKLWLVIGVIFICVAGIVLMVAQSPRTLVVADDGVSSAVAVATEATSTHPVPMLDAAAYDAKMQQIANVPMKRVVVTSTVMIGTSTVVITTSTLRRARSLWPVKNVPYPNAGALLPFNRIVAYYGNFYSTQMGVLGEYPPDQMLAMLASTTAMWAAADPSTPVIPALDYIVVTAQGSPGSDGDYRLRMPPDQIQKAISMANQIHGVVFLDVQVGGSNVETEVPLLAAYFKLPNVELSIDPEFAMHNGKRPGTVIGTLDASDINFAAHFLANIVDQNNLPPKILVVHRFTQAMVTNYQNIMPLPEVQVVMDMDGFGPPAQKLTTYQDFIASEPVQFTGFKLFYKNDIRVPGSHLLTPVEVLKLSPQPSYIQYQ